MFDFRWLRPNEAEYYQPYARLKGGTRWPQRDEKRQTSPARRDRRR